jgi:hypothetical protein
MSKRTMIAGILAVLIVQAVLIGCKKTETTGTKSQITEEQHQEAMVLKSFEESKMAIAATVNNEPITKFALLREMNVIAAQYVKPGQTPTPELSAKIREDALNNLIFQELAVQEARKRGLHVNPETIDNAIKNIVAKQGSLNAYQKYLSDNGLSEQELRRIIDQDALFELIATQEVDARIKVTDEELRQRYNRERAGLKDAAHKELTFEAAKGMLEQKLREEAGEKRMRVWEKELKKKARIKIFEKRKAG